MTTNQNLLDTAVQAATLAGDVLATKFGGPRTIEQKGLIDLVTDADKAAEDAALGHIRATFPEHAILAEEEGASGSSRTRWIVDPLDGTTNYAHGIPHFCVSVACEVDGRLQVAAILDPMRRELFTASRGGGAFLNGERIFVTGESRLDHAVLATGFPYWVQERPGEVLALFGDFLARARGIRRFGAAALDLAWVAAGRYDGFFELKLKPWDVAAGILLVKEAGGTVSGFAGDVFDFADGNILASSQGLHQALVTLAAKHA